MHVPSIKLFQWIWNTAACILSNTYKKELSSFMISCSLSCFPARSQIQLRAVEFKVLRVLERMVAICFSNLNIFLVSSKKCEAAHFKDKTGQLDGMFVEGLAHTSWRLVQWNIWFAERHLDKIAFSAHVIGTSRPDWKGRHFDQWVNTFARVCFNAKFGLCFGNNKGLRD